MKTKRLRILAGPNGSGKTSVYRELSQYEHPNFGIFVNADDIEACLKQRGIFSFRDYAIDADKTAFISGYEEFLKSKSSQVAIDDVAITDNFLVVSNRDKIDSYFACYLATFIRDEMIQTGVERITIETVMSHPGKLDLIRRAREMGYRVYLYYVSTSDPQINVDRVKARQQMGGHGVSLEKIKSRYARSMDNLYEAMLLSDRAFLFDNSGTNHVFIAEYDAQKELLRVIGENSPYWLQEYVVDKAR